jgi:hypothetical protein
MINLKATKCKGFQQRPTTVSVYELVPGIVDEYKTWLQVGVGGRSVLGREYVLCEWCSDVTLFANIDNSHHVILFCYLL